MDKLLPFTVNDLARVTNHRSGEIKFGEKMLTVPKDRDASEFLVETDAKYVLFGIPEDIGVRANYGSAGTASAWESAIRTICNIQNNRYCKGSKILILGSLNVVSEMRAVVKLDFLNSNDRKKLSDLVEIIDKEVSHIISVIVAAGKIPIIIGGGQNNAYGNIKGTALAKGKQVNAINFDAHSDFRILEGRHSGNAFSYVFEEGFLKKYFIFGLHESYTTKSVLDRLKSESRVRFVTYDEINIRRRKDFQKEMESAMEFVSTDHYGLEIDLDSIPGIASHGMTISGFSVEETRRFVTYFAANSNVSYLHICEGAPALADATNSHLIGNLIGYLVTDFIKANTEATE